MVPSLDKPGPAALDRPEGSAAEPAGTMLELDEVAKRYPDGTVAVRDLSLSIARGDVVALVGPSGCGKSTTLRMINRLIEPTSGRIILDGSDVTDVNPVKLRRRIGYVIQQVGLFPHVTVARNVATVPRLLGWESRRTRDRVEELLDLVGLDPGVYANRYPSELSGGQRQRVGVARALAADPPVLLMDEPFGAVDPIARDRLQLQFREIATRLDKTVVLVTHDIDEAVRMSDKVAVLAEGGVLQQYADPATLLAAPANDFVADFVGADRGLRRLAVTAIEDEDLDHPPTVLLSDSVEQAFTRLKAVGNTAVGSRAPAYAIVLDEAGHLRGWVAARHLVGAGRTVESAVRRFDETVDVSESLRDGLSRLVQHDAGWLPVLDGDRYLGVLSPASVHAALRRTVPDENADIGAA